MYKQILIMSMLTSSILVADHYHLSEEQRKDIDYHKKHFSETEKTKSEVKKEFTAQEKHEAEFKKAKSDLLKSCAAVVATPLVFLALGYIMCSLGLDPVLTNTFGRTASNSIQYALVFGNACIGGYAVYKGVIGGKHYFWPNIQSQKR
jgi:hypothetical protein